MVERGVFTFACYLVKLLLVSVVIPTFAQLTRLKHKKRFCPPLTLSLSFSLSPYLCFSTSLSNYLYFSPVVMVSHVSVIFEIDIRRSEHLFVAIGTNTWWFLVGRTRFNLLKNLHFNQKRDDSTTQKERGKHHHPRGGKTTFLLHVSLI